MFTHHHNPLRSARLGGTLIALALTAGLAACDDDSGNKGVSAAACDAVVALGSAMSAAPQDPAEFATFAEQQLVPIGRTLAEEMTGDGKKAAETLSAAYDDVAETGDPTPLFESPDVTKASGTIGSIVHKGCDLQAVKVGAIEYAFTDIPSELDAGRVSFALENEGVEEHEMVLFKRNEGVTQPLEELLELPEEELMSKVTFTGVAFGGPGTTNYVAMDLEPGTYFLLCFIPQGEDGPPHFMGGMSRTVTVF